MTDTEAEQILAMLQAAYPHADNGIDPTQAKDRRALYRGMIKSWKQPTLGMQAAVSVIRESKWWPTIAELDQAYDALARHAHPERQPVAGLLSDGNNPATPEEVRAACAEAIARVERNAVAEPARPKRRDWKAAAAGEET